MKQPHLDHEKCSERIWKEGVPCAEPAGEPAGACDAEPEAGVAPGEAKLSVGAVLPWLLPSSSSD
eukprot:6631421-Prymnesium_polylepis.1